MPDRLVMLENFEYRDGRGWSCKFYKHSVYGANHADLLPEGTYKLIGDKQELDESDYLPDEPELVCEDFEGNPDDLLLDPIDDLDEDDLDDFDL